MSPGKSYSKINLDTNDRKTLGETYLGLVTTELSVVVCKTLKADRKPDGAAEGAAARMENDSPDTAVWAY